MENVHMKDILTEKQKNLLQIICDYVDNKHVAPSVRELAELFKIKSSSVMHGYLRRLRDKGYITWLKGTRRTIQVLKRV
jgi:SOS-response transcriptional repressor LexA